MEPITIPAIAPPDNEDDDDDDTTAAPLDEDDTPASTAEVGDAADVTVVVGAAAEVGVAVEARAEVGVGVLVVVGAEVGVEVAAVGDETEVGGVPLQVYAALLVNPYIIPALVGVGGVVQPSSVKAPLLLYRLTNAPAVESGLRLAMVEDNKYVRPPPFT